MGNAKKIVHTQALPLMIRSSTGNIPCNKHSSVNAVHDGNANSKQVCHPWPSAAAVCRQPSKSTNLAPAASLMPPLPQLTPSPLQRFKSHQRREDLLQIAIASQHAQCVRVVVDGLIEGRFSKTSVMMHMYEALQGLIHDQQVCGCVWGGMGVISSCAGRDGQLCPQPTPNSLFFMLLWVCSRLCFKVLLISLWCYLAAGNSLCNRSIHTVLAELWWLCSTCMQLAHSAAVQLCMYCKTKRSHSQHQCKHDVSHTL